MAFLKDPDAVLDYTIDWSSWLASGDTLSTVTWTVPSGLTLDSESSTTTTGTVWLSGGTAGTRYSVACRITTVSGRTDDRSLTVQVQER